jgi:hypothetical protein
MHWSHQPRHHPRRRSPAILDTFNRDCMFDSIESSYDRPSPSRFLLRKIRRFRGVSKWPIAEAKVLSCSWVLSDGPDGSVGEFKIDFTFDLGGISYYGSFSLPGYGSARLFANGDIIPVQYNPKNPNQSLYLEAWSKGEAFCVLIVVICLLFVGHWLITGSPWFSLSTKGD